MVVVGFGENKFRKGHLPSSALQWSRASIEITPVTVTVTANTPVTDTATVLRPIFRPNRVRSQ